MYELVALDDLNVVEFRDTPWDTRAFGFPTCELISIKYSSRIKLDGLLRKFSSVIVSRGIKFCYCRINAEDHDLKMALQRAGYYYAETSILLSKQNFGKENFGELFNNNMTLSAPVAEEDFRQIKIIAQDAFRYSRFHEDPNIPHDRAELRYFNWIDDLRAQNKEFFILKNGNTVHSFLAFSTEGRTVTLVVGGSAEGRGYLSPFFWSSFMTEFQRRGIKKVTGIISAANIVIFNLYISLNFRVDKALLGFHRFYTEGDLYE